MDIDQVHIIVMGMIIILSLGLTVVYYFVRYYFKTDENDIELSPHLKKSISESTSKSVDVSASPKSSVENKDKEELEPALAKSQEPLHVHDQSYADKKELIKKDEATLENQSESTSVVAKKISKPSIEDAHSGHLNLRSEISAPRKELKEALKNTKSGILGRIKQAFSSQEIISEDDIEILEEILYTSDLGPSAVQRLVTSVSEKMNAEDKSNFESLRLALKSEMELMLQDENSEDMDSFFKKSVGKDKPFVLMVVGVNGAGKTTTIGKLASKSTSLGFKTLVVAGDTFRAAAEDQLRVWSERANVDIFNPENTKDPSAVAFDGVNKAKNQGYEVVIIDTAGRLHTQDNLMEELKKMKRVMKKVLETAPHETFIVLDANSGQNALIQAKYFNEALDLSGVVLTKLDGSAKGGVALGLAYELGLKIKFIGVGEGIDDLRSFEPKEFVNSII